MLAGIAALSIPTSVKIPLPPSCFWDPQLIFTHLFAFSLVLIHSHPFFAYSQPLTRLPPSFYTYEPLILFFWALPLPLQLFLLIFGFFHQFSTFLTFSLFVLGFYRAFDTSPSTVNCTLSLLCVPDLPETVSETLRPFFYKPRLPSSFWPFSTVYKHFFLFFWAVLSSTTYPDSRTTVFSIHRPFSSHTSHFRPFSLISNHFHHFQLFYTIFNLSISFFNHI